MISFKAIVAICLGATLCTAQSINISGIVKDTAGVGISGATVKLEKAAISTTTGSDGSFTLTNGSMQIQPNFRRSAVSVSPMQIQNGKVVFTLSENTPIAICIHDVRGRQVDKSKKMYGSGTHTIEAPLQSTGICLYMVKIGNGAYSFKSSPFGTLSTKNNATAGNRSALAKQASAMDAIADVIAVLKEGQLNYRDSIKTSDTTGIVVKMIPNAGNVKDTDGNVYQSVRIGSQVWTVENLKTTKYNDGTAIPSVTDNIQWSDLTTGHYCYYDNNPDYRDNYGALYNWHAVNTGKLAPEGWRVPTDTEWDTLQNYLISNKYNWDGTTSGNKIAKSLAAKTDWRARSSAGSAGNDLSKNNASGFTALPGGSRFYDGGFLGVGDSGEWWSTSEYGALGAWARGLGYGDKELIKYGYRRSCGFSVRLLRDSD